MKTIDLQAIIDAKQLDVKEVAQQLFPTNQYPRLALNRVLAGKALLDAAQISKLSLLSGVDIGDLYADNNWEAESKNGLHTFTNGDWTATLDTTTWLTKIFHKTSMKHESVIHSPNTPLSEYIQALNNVILNINQNEN